jgi:hypothetical protein
MEAPTPRIGAELRPGGMAKPIQHARSKAANGRDFNVLRHWSAAVANGPGPHDVMAAALRSAFASKADIRTGREKSPKEVNSSLIWCLAVRHRGRAQDAPGPPQRSRCIPLRGGRVKVAIPRSWREFTPVALPSRSTRYQIGFAAQATT